MLQSVDTIAAIATGVARGGIGVVRISGNGLEGIMSQLLGCSLIPRHATYLSFLGNEKEIIDRGIAIYFPAPNSYTGEEVLELQGHGGVAVLNLLLQRCLQLGARIAQPGEFTKRAYLNHKIDLIQAESVADLINATSQQAVRSANRSLQGVFSQAVERVVSALIELRIQLEASFDFPEENLLLDNTQKHRDKLKLISAAVDDIFRSATQGAILREGAHIALIGEPNVGKSSLLNSLSGDEVALVSDIPGTTRDINRQEISINGVPFHIFDTAGLRESEDVVERMGIEKTKQFIHKSDVALFIVEASSSVPRLNTEILKLLPQDIFKIVVVNKIDLLAQSARTELIDNTHFVYVSAKTGEGLELLRDCLLKVIGWQNDTSVFTARERHLQALNRTQECLLKAYNHLDQIELMAEELRRAQVFMSEVTGEYSSDDLLGDIFSRFCIGK